MNGIVHIPICQLRSKSGFLVYDSVEYPHKSGNFGAVKKMALMAANKVKQTGRHGFSAGAKKRLTRALSNLSLLAPRRWKVNPATGRLQLHEMTMITLTIPDNTLVTGKEAYDELFEPFIRWLTRYAVTSRDKKGVKHWVSKVEKQRRGQLHYHLFTPSMVHKDHIRKKWNQLISAAGLMDKYQEKYGNAQPFSTDVRSFSSENLDWYMRKEIAKQEQNVTDLNSKVWSCSAGLEEAYFEVVYTDKFQRKVERLVKQKKMGMKSGERWMMAYLRDAWFNYIKCVLSEKDYFRFLERIRCMGAGIEVPDPIRTGVDTVEGFGSSPVDRVAALLGIRIDKEFKPPSLEVSMQQLKLWKTE